jgi:hypothetical protein
VQGPDKEAETHSLVSPCFLLHPLEHGYDGTNQSYVPQHVFSTCWPGRLILRTLHLPRYPDPFVERKIYGYEEDDLRRALDRIFDMTRELARTKGL